ncbi:MAG: phage GP46 family protein [Burkholderiales bacterium]|nr:phage GP46 family protein [Burkholderiales bacterium]
MDFALQYSPEIGGLDIAVDVGTGDFVREDTLVTAMMLSLFLDSLAQEHEVAPGADRRGWWADVFSPANADAAREDSTGSRLWLLAREKQLPVTQARLQAYLHQALQWMVDDGLITGKDVTVFIPRTNWYAAIVELHLNGSSRRFRFEWNALADVWRFEGEQ